MNFPVYIHVGRYVVHPHLLFELLGYSTAAVMFVGLRRRFGDTVPGTLRWAVLAAAMAGGLFGAKALTWLEDPRLTLEHVHDPAYFLGGKTIIGGLAGGVLVVELFKWYVGMRVPTGDLYAVPIALGVAIGRVGCFLTGLADNTYGTPTRLPWGVDFGDGIKRHPTQVYEIVFLLALAPVLYAILRSVYPLKPGTRPEIRGGLGTSAGDPFKLFMVMYATFRLLVDFLKPYPRVVLGLGSIQIVCIAILVYYAGDARRWLRSALT